MDQRNAEIFEHELLNPLRGHRLSDHERHVANMLLDASGGRPIDNQHLRISLGLRFHQEFSDRAVKDIIRTLRKEHAFPILARRSRPWGYWWCSSKEEMEEFIKVFRAQALDELHTLGRIVRANFPELAGQLRLVESDAEKEE